MDKIFIIWHDYAGNYIEKFNFEEKEKAEEKCMEIKRKKHSGISEDDCGIQIDAVIQGKELKITTVAVVAKVSLK